MGINDYVKLSAQEYNRITKRLNDLEKQNQDYEERISQLEVNSEEFETRIEDLEKED